MKYNSKLIGSKFRVQSLQLFETSYYIYQDPEHPTLPIG